MSDPSTSQSGEPLDALADLESQLEALLSEIEQNDPELLREDPEVQPDGLSDDSATPTSPSPEPAPAPMGQSAHDLSLASSAPSVDDAVPAAPEPSADDDEDAELDFEELEGSFEAPPESVMSELDEAWDEASDVETLVQEPRPRVETGDAPDEQTIDELSDEALTSTIASLLESAREPARTSQADPAPEPGADAAQDHAAEASEASEAADVAEPSEAIKADDADEDLLEGDFATAQDLLGEELADEIDALLRQDRAKEESEPPAAVTSPSAESSASGDGDEDPLEAAAVDAMLRSAMAESDPSPSLEELPEDLGEPQATTVSAGTTHLADAANADSADRAEMSEVEGDVDLNLDSLAEQIQGLIDDAASGRPVTEAGEPAHEPALDDLDAMLAQEADELSGSFEPVESFDPPEQVQQLLADPPPRREDNLDGEALAGELDGAELDDADFEGDFEAPDVLLDDSTELTATQRDAQTRAKADKAADDVVLEPAAQPEPASAPGRKPRPRMTFTASAADVARELSADEAAAVSPADECEPPKVEDAEDVGPTDRAPAGRRGPLATALAGMTAWCAPAVVTACEMANAPLNRLSPANRDLIGYVGAQMVFVGLGLLLYALFFK